MASEALDKAGLHFDDLNRIRVLDEDSSSQAQELKEVCQDFLGDIGDFQVKHQESGVGCDVVSYSNVSWYNRMNIFRKSRTVSL